MSPSLRLGSSRRGGISELYASVLMVGVTLAIGGIVVSSALGQFALANDSASLSALTQDASDRTQIGMVYVAVSPSVSCPLFGGYHEGTTVRIAVYNYGESPFTPAEIILNESLYAGSYAPLGPGSLGTYTLMVTKCAHASGQTVIVADSAGDEVEIES